MLAYNYHLSKRFTIEGFSMKKLLFLFLFLLSCSPLLAVLYDYEAIPVSEWQVYDASPAGAMIKVQENEWIGYNTLHGDGLNNGFMLGNRTSAQGWNNQEDNTITWRINNFDSYVVYIPVETTKGTRYLTYTPRDEDRGIRGQYIRFGLGSDSHITDNWVYFTRNLERDLHKFEPDNDLVAINGFMIRGTGNISEIKTSYYNPEIKYILQTGMIADNRTDWLRMLSVNLDTGLVEENQPAREPNVLSPKLIEGSSNLYDVQFLTETRHHFIYYLDENGHYAYLLDAGHEDARVTLKVNSDGTQLEMMKDFYYEPFDREFPPRIMYYDISNLPAITYLDTSLFFTYRENFTYPTEDSIALEFRLSEKCQLQIEYGTTTAYGQWTKKEESFKYSTHRQTIRDLTPGTYHFRVHAWDEKGNEIITEDYSFTIEGDDSNPVEQGIGLTIDQWKVYDNTPEGATITLAQETVFGTDYSTLLLNGDKYNNGYMYGGRTASDGWNDTDSQYMRWTMRSNEPFVIYIPVTTTLGTRYLTYSPIDNGRVGVNGQYVRYLLDTKTASGIWQTTSRDLARDVRHFEPENELISIHGFMIRGSVEIANITRE